MKKEKIAFFPMFEFEAGMSVFFDKDKYEIIPVNFQDKELIDRFSQKLYGEICAPLKFCVGLTGMMVVLKNVKKFFWIVENICQQPIILGDLQKLINKKFEYYSIRSDSFVISFKWFFDAFYQLKQAIPGFNFLKYCFLIPHSIKKIFLAKKFQDFYLKKIPLSKNPKFFKKRYLKFKQDFITAKTLKEARKIFFDFKNYTHRMQVIKTPKHKFIISGDFFVLGMEFYLFDLEVFLAKNNIEIIQKYSATNSFLYRRFSKHFKKAKKQISKKISNKNKKIKVSKNHLIEIVTLEQIFRGMDEESVDGIIFLKPVMCTPCENLSLILKENNYFNLPFLEISYDEHSGMNGLLTRFEAFLNIIDEKDQPKKRKGLPLI